MAFSFLAFLKLPLVKDLVTWSTKKGYDLLLNNREVYRILAELGIARPVDKFDRLYMHSVFLFASRDIHPEFIQLLLLPESVQAFKEEYLLEKGYSFVDVLDEKLRSHELVDQIGDWEEVPMHQIDIFAGIFKDLVNQIASPVEREMLNNQNELRDMMIQTQKELSAGFKSIKLEEQPVNVAAVERTNDPLQLEYQGQVDDFTKDLEAGSFQRAIDGFLRLKTKNWTKINDGLRFRILTNLGVAFYQLMNNEQAAKYLIEAYSYQPDGLTSLCNVVNAYMAVENQTEARRYLGLLLEKFPGEVAAHATRIKMDAEMLDLKALLKPVPKHLKKQPEILASLGMAARKQHNLELSIDYLSKAHHLLPDDNFIQQHLLQSWLESYSMNFKLLNLKIIDTKTQQDLTALLTLINSQQDNAVRTGHTKLRAHLFHAEGFVRCAMQDFTDGIAALDRGLSIDPANQHILKQKGFAYALSGELASAIISLKKIKDHSAFPDVPCLLAECYRNDGRPAEGITLLSKFIRVSGNEGQEELYFKQQSVHILVDLVILEKRDALVKKLLKGHFKSVSITDLLSRSKLLRYLGSNEEAEPLVLQVYHAIGDNTTYREKMFVAEELQSYGLYNEAILVLKGLVDIRHPSSPSFKLYKLYHKIGKARECLNVLSALREANGPLFDHTWLEVDLLQELGDYVNAAGIAAQYCKKFPDQQSARVILSSIYLRLGAIRKAKLIHSHSFTYWKFSDSVFRNYIAQLIALSKRKKAYHSAYEFQRLRDNEGALLSYTAVFSQFPDPVLLAEQDAAGLDSAVELQNEGGQSFKFILEDRPAAELRSNEINGSDARFRMLIGKKTGDTIILDKNGYPWTIVRIQSKFAHALSIAKLKLSTVYAKIPENDEVSESTEKQLEADFRQMVLNDQVFTAYASGQMSLGNAASLLNQPVIHLWQNFSRLPKIGIFSAGFPGDNLFESSASLQCKTLTVDISSLLILHQLSLYDQVHQAFGKLNITTSTYDLIHDAYQHSKDYQPEGNSDLQLKALLNSTNRYCQEVFPETILDLDLRKKAELDRAIGKSFSDTMVLATELKNVYWTDEGVLREVMRLEDEVEGTWTQAVILHLLHAKFITRAEYNYAVIKLVLLNYKQTSLDPYVLLDGFLHFFVASPKTFEHCLCPLGPDFCALDSGINVQMAFFKMAWQVNNISDELKSRMTELTILTFAKGRDPNAVIERFISALGVEIRKDSSQKSSMILKKLKIEFKRIAKIMQDLSGTQ